MEFEERDCNKSDDNHSNDQHESGSASSAPSLVPECQFGQAVFHDIDDIYPTDCDIRVRYTLADIFRPTQGDKIALFIVGWRDRSNFIVSKPAPMPMSEKENSTLRVTFSANLLPKDEKELFQFCYLNSENKLIGASIPFGFRRPLENELIVREDKFDRGLMVYISRTAVLYEKIAALEEDKESANLKVYTLGNQISVLKKELSSVSSTNKYLSTSLENANEDVNLLTNSLKRVKTELEQLQKVHSNCETEIGDIKSKFENLNASLKAKEEEMQNLLVMVSELNGVKQEKVNAELTLKEVSQYNANLKEELDILKEHKESLIANKLIMQNEIGQLRESLQQQQHSAEENKLIMQNEIGQLRESLQQQQHSAEKPMHPSAPPAGTNMDNTPDVLELQAQLDHVLQLLDDTLQNQPVRHQQEEYVVELENKIKVFEENESKYKENISNLNNIITQQYQEMKNMNDNLVHLQSFEETYIKKEKDALEELNNLKVLNEQILAENNSINEKLKAMDEESGRMKNEHEAEKQALLKKLDELEKVSKTSEKKEELEEVVKCLREALISEPSFEESYRILVESTRINAMKTYKDLFVSLQFLDFENIEIGRKVHRLLNEFSILKQDLDRCRQENETMKKDLYEANKELKTVKEENELNKSKVIELNEVVREINNCLDAVKKDIVEPAYIKELKDQITSLTNEKDDLEKQLKEAKIASALTSIGHVTVDQRTLKLEIEHLKQKVKELENQQSVASHQNCCEKMEERLKQSAKEYAKLYNQLLSERGYYQKLISSISSSPSPTSSAAVSSSTSNEH